jgi:hypothetical protein
MVRADATRGERAAFDLVVLRERGTVWPAQHVSGSAARTPAQ